MSGRGGPEGLRAYLLEGIATGTFVRGQKLPTERELARRFSLTRSAVRKVLTFLEAEGRVVRRVGSGTFISGQTREVGSEDWSKLSLRQLIEARLALEPQLAALAVANATAADLRQIGIWVERCCSAADIGAFEEADHGFHVSIAEATHNHLLIKLYEVIGRVRNSEQWRSLKNRRHIERPDRRLTVCREHQSILDALKSRDQDAARELMFNHLVGVRRNLFSF